MATPQQVFTLTCNNQKLEMLEKKIIKLESALKIKDQKIKKQQDIIIEYKKDIELLELGYYAIKNLE